MKQKLSITIDEEMVAKIEEQIKQGIFRNKSHIFEFSIKQFLEDKIKQGGNQQ